MSDRLGMVGAASARGDRAVFAKSQGRKDGGTAVGAGATIGTLGLVGGGIPGARPDSGRLAHALYGTRRGATKHLVSAARGGIFGYREDAHRSFVNRQNSDLRGWKAHDRGNHFERGMAQGKVRAENQIIRHLHAGRIASNVAFGGGAALTAAGALQRRKTMAKRSDDFRSNTAIGAGTTLAAAGGLGSVALEHQGQKWARRSAEKLDQTFAHNPRMGGYDLKYHRKNRFAPRKNRVPDVTPRRDKGDVLWNSGHIFGDKSDAHAAQAGKFRGEAAQHRYFARVYGNQAKISRKVGAAGALLAAGGLGTKYLQVKPREVEKVDTSMSDDEANRLARRYDTRGPLPKQLSREQRMKAYEARYIAAGGKQGEKWKRRADHAEVGRNLGLAGATAAGAMMLGHKAPGLRRIPRHRLEHAAVAAGTFGGASELYGEHARSRRASYQNSPAGVAGSALSRMQAYTPGRKS